MKVVTTVLAAAALVIGVVHAEVNVVDLGTGDFLSIVMDESLAIHAAPATPTRPATVIIKDAKAIAQSALSTRTP